MHESYRVKVRGTEIEQKESEFFQEEGFYFYLESIDPMVQEYFVDTDIDTLNRIDE